MNTFYLHEDPVIAAEMHCDKHAVKMPVESGQMLSTVHRYLDGNPCLRWSKTGRTMKHWEMEDANKESKLYKVAHLNHPSTIWTRESSENYLWHYELFKALLGEYTYRYGKVHKSAQLLDMLSILPKNIPEGEFTQPPQCMPDQYKCDDAVQAYRNYYLGEKAGFAKWKAREVPTWFNYDNI
jgi:hypothetical protein